MKADIWGSGVDGRFVRILPVRARCSEGSLSHTTNNILLNIDLHSGTRKQPLFHLVHAMNTTTDFEPNVTTEQGLRELAENGHSVEVLCKTAPERKGPSWYGLWTMRTISNDGHEKLLVTARTRPSQNDIRVREFKTATGIISFLIGVGFSQASIPLVSGEKTSHRLVNS